jgi:hypothetical protein
MKLEQKLTMRALGWSRGKIEEAVGKVPSDGGRVLLGRVAGIIVGTKLAKDVNDEVIVGLKGNFRGVSSVDNETVTSGICFLPSGIQGMLESALAEARQKDQNATVQFAMDVYAIPAKNLAGYSFNADNILGNEDNDPLTALLADANAKSPLQIENKAADAKGK